ncbi:MAG: hypothetical protein P1P88_25800 [Bacteroidales bacterium]|nr:hypothetical protein [Bacteroidales bacterium]
MEAYKFETIVLENGTIKLPHFEKYKNQQIEVFVVFKNPTKVESKKLTASEFLDKWTGFISELNIEDEKYNYLINKYK